MSETIDSAFEKCLDMLEAEGATIETCVTAYPQHAQELREMLTLAQTLKPLQQLTPDAAFKKNAGTRLVDKLPDRPVTFFGFIRRILHRQEQKPVRRLRMIKILITAMTLLSFAIGGVFAADTAGPGDMLYGLNRTVEQFRLSLLNNPEKITTYRLTLANTRLEEAKNKLSQGDLENALTAFEGYDSEIAALAELVAASKGPQGEALMALLEEALSNHQVILTDLLEKVPEQAQAAIYQALQVSISMLDIPPFDPPFDPPGEPPFDPPDAPPVDPPDGPPVDPPDGPPFDPPGEPPFDPPDAPPFDPPDGPPFDPPNGPPFDPPGEPPFDPPDGPPFDPPGEPPFDPPDAPPVDPPNGPPVDPPDGPPFDPPGEPPIDPPNGPPVDPPDGPPVDPPDSPPVDPPDGPPVDPPDAPPIDPPDGPPVNKP